MYKEKIINAITGEETYRNYTPVEVAEVEAAIAEGERISAEIKAKQAIRDSALAKLAELGLTADEIASL